MFNSVTESQHTVLQSVTVPPWNVHTELYVGTSGPTMRLKVDNSGQGGSGKLDSVYTTHVWQKKYTNTNTQKYNKIYSKLTIAARGGSGKLDLPAVHTVY